MRNIYKKSVDDFVEDLSSISFVEQNGGAKELILKGKLDKELLSKIAAKWVKKKADDYLERERGLPRRKAV